MTIKSNLVIPGFYLPYIERFVATLGIDASQMWQVSGIEKHAFDPQTDSISEDQLNKFVMTAKALSGVNSLGIQLGRQFSLASYGLLSRAMMSCQNFRDATDLVSRFAGLSFPLVSFSSKELTDNFVLYFNCLSKHESLNRVIAEAIISNMNANFQFLTGHQLSIDCIGLIFSEPHYSSEFNRTIAEEFKFNQRENYILIKNSYVDLPFLTANEADMQLAIKQFKLNELETGKDQDMIQQVSELIKQKLPDNPSAPEIASHLNLSERSLRRQLQKHDMSYRMLLALIRERTAKSLLSETQLTVTQIAIELGYQEVANFRSAFKKWTGKTPVEWKLENYQ
ncbi:MAG: AraC family transcriptional regulator [Pseudomonadales bacterium]|nr:AraC family transcriptional regulator [Pseudomonadales bacterium]